ncbi:MAG: cell division protein FtsQ/DivIB [Muribaculaceae bacterium]|nr:cell division protein FtsQ/DivIB [Muribaculaceae bacterium]MDE6345669.1 cell division protein FtsQ/DivIB [Muribaculaceae bacterium]
MLTKRGITLCILSLMLTVYLVIALATSQGIAAEAPCTGVRISVSQNQMSQFVTPEDIDHELGGITASADSMAASAYNLKNIEQRLGTLSIIEDVNCRRLANDVIAIDVVPMIPVARVFDRNGSYYINKAGKHLQASARYQIDVPVVITDNDTLDNAGEIIPLLERIDENKTWSQLVSALKVDRNGDIFIIPSVSGHIVNIGDGNNIDDKMTRLFAFYNQVLDVKGWNYYDTISVKFANQVIGKIVPGRLRKNPVDTEGLEYEDEDIDIDIINQRDSVNVADIKPKII